MEAPGSWTPPWVDPGRPGVLLPTREGDACARGWASAIASALGASPDAAADAAVRSACAAASGLGFPPLRESGERVDGALLASCVRETDGAVLVAGFGAYDPRGAARSTGAASDKILEALEALALERAHGNEARLPEAVFLVTFSEVASKTRARARAAFRRSFVATAWETLFDPAAHPWVPRQRVLWDPDEEARVARDLLNRRAWAPRDPERWNLPRVLTTDAVAARMLARHGDVVLVDRDAGDENTPALALRVVVDPDLPFLAGA